MTSYVRKSGHLRHLLHAAVLVGLVVAGTKYLDSDTLWMTLQRFDWHYVPGILSLTVAYLLVKGHRFVFQMRQFTRTSARVILEAYIAGQACTVIPGGVTARAGMLRQAGIPVADSAASIALASASDQAVLLLSAVISAFWFESARAPVAAFLVILLLAGALLRVRKVRAVLLSGAERVAGRLHLLDRWHSFRDSLGRVCTFPLLSQALVNAAVALALMVVALAFAVRGVGAEIPYPTLLLAFSLPALLGRLSPMPAGVGVTDAGMVGILDATPGITLSTAVAATLIFRLGTTFFAALLGGVTYFFIWRKTSRRLAAQPAEAG